MLFNYMRLMWGQIIRKVILKCGMNKALIPWHIRLAANMATNRPFFSPIYTNSLFSLSKSYPSRNLDQTCTLCLSLAFFPPLYLQLVLKRLCAPRHLVTPQRYLSCSSHSLPHFHYSAPILFISYLCARYIQCIPKCFVFFSQTNKIFLKILPLLSVNYKRLLTVQ